MLAIKNNMMSLNAARNLGVNYDRLSTSVERLSSGLRINGAKDDAAGLAVRELIRADVAALNQGVRNANDGVSMLQSAEGALGEIDSILIRMKELTEQANTGTYSSTQTSIMQQEFDELCDEIDRIVTSTGFNGNTLLDNTNTVSISLGQGSSTGAVSVTGQNMTADALGLSGTKATAVGATSSAVGNAYFTNGDALNPATITFTFGATSEPGATTKELTLSFTASESKTLTQVVDQLNAQSRSLLDGWNTASIRGDATHGYQLVLTAHASGDLSTANDLVVGNTTNDINWAAGTTSSGNVLQAGFNLLNGSGTAVNVTVGATATTIQTAIETKDSFRAQLGYKMNRLEAAAAVLAVQAENLSAAESRISDVDVATEMSEMTRSQVLAQAGISMLSQANSMPQMALQLLQS